MPSDSELESRQIPTGSFLARLGSAVGRPVIVYLREVCADLPLLTPAPPGTCPPGPGVPASPPGEGTTTGGTPIVPGFPGTGDVGPIVLEWHCPPEVTPPPAMPTTAVSGSLARIGPDFVVIQGLVDGTCTEIIIPNSAIGLIVF